MCVPFNAVLVASLRRVVFTTGPTGTGSDGSSGFGVCQAPPSHLSSWLSFGVLYSLSTVFCTIMFSCRSIGRMFSSWCSGSRGVVWKVPKISLTALFWTFWS